MFKNNFYKANSNFYLNDGGEWHDPKVSPGLLKQWNRWVTENKIF